MSTARRTIRGFRFKYGGLFKRLLTSYNIVMIIIICILASLLIIQEYDDQSESTPSILDDFQSAASLGRYAVHTKSETTKNKVPTKQTISVDGDDTTDRKDYDVEEGPPMNPPKHLPVIKVRYYGKHSKSKSRKHKAKEVRLITPKKLTNRDVLNAMAHPNLFPATQPSVGDEGHHRVSTSLNDWVQANNPRDANKFLVYSAFWDDRFDQNNNVRVMAITATKNPPSVFCRLQMADGKQIDARVNRKVMNEHWKLRYSSCFLSCEVDKNVPPPLKVLLSLNRNFTFSAMLPVHQNKENVASPRGDLAVCVKPLHYAYDRATWLLEFIEFHRVLGVEHFFFYNHTIGPNVDRLLRNYISQGVVTMLPWTLPVKSQKEIRTEAIFSSLNDCVFRTMHLFHYVILLDFDEYIVPREHDTYIDMIEKLTEDNKHIRGRPGSFVFKNVFFYLYWENDTTVYGMEPEVPPQRVPYLLTQYKTRRLTSAMKIGSRSKYIVVPDRVLEVGNHVVWRHTSGSRTISVPDTVGLLHHYRICEFGGFTCLKKDNVVDRTATRFGPDLLKRVMRQCRIIFPDLNGECPLSPPLGSPW